MRHILLTAMAVATVTSANAESALDLRSRMALHAEKIGISTDAAGIDRPKPLRRIADSSTGDKLIASFIKLNDGQSAAELEANGATVLSQRGNIALCLVPMSDVERIAELPSVKRMSLSHKVSAKMDIARAVTGIDKIHSGESLPHAYTGKGVVAGIVDNGFDPGHTAFINADGTPRISHFMYIDTDESTGAITAHTYEGMPILDIHTDHSGTYHGSHTLNIMAGSRGGSLQVAAVDKDDSSLSTVTEAENPFYGVAYDANMVAVSSDLNDMLIAYGIEDILEYADNANSPVVINLSLGSNLGPHDGTQAMNQYLDAFAEETGVPICVSAGNEGDLPIVLTKTLTEEDNSAACFIEPYVQEGTRYGELMVYSDDETPFILEAIIYNTVRGTIADVFSVTENTDMYPIWFGNQGIANSTLTRYFGDESYIGLGTAIDPENGRYYGLISLYTDNTSANANDQYIVGFKITGSAGQRIDVYGDGYYQVFSNYGQEGYDEPTTNGTLNDMACGHNTIAVGSWTTRETWPLIGGTTDTYGFAEGLVSPFSSYATLIDGRNLPDVCAPGASIISACNYYFAANEEMGIIPEMEMSARLDREGRTDYYIQSVGTSMSTPLVAGAIATWLEADPTLDYSRVKEIIKETASVDDAVKAGDPVQWGAGKFDAYEGLKEVLRQAGVTDMAAKNTDMVLSYEGGNVYRAFLAGEANMTASVYTVSGTKVMEAASDSDEVRIDCSGLVPGIYVMTVNGTNSVKISIK